MHSTEPKSDDALPAQGRLKPLAAFRAAWATLLDDPGPYVVYWVVLRLALLGLIGPAWSAILDFIQSTGGLPALGNMDIVGFFLSPRGLMFGLLLGAGVVSEIWLERSGFIIIAERARAGLRTRGIHALWLALRALRRTFLTALFFIGLLAAVTMPFLAIVGLIARRLLAQHDINYYLAVRPPEFWRWGALVAVVAVIWLVLVAWLYVRAYHLLNVAIVEDRSLRGAVRRSAELTARRRWTIGAVIACWWGSSALLLAGVMTIYRMFAGWYIDRLGTGLSNAVIGIVLMGGLLMIIVLVLSFLFNVGETLIALDVYHQSTDAAQTTPAPAPRWLDVQDRTLSGRLVHGIAPHAIAAVILVAAATVLLASPLTGRSEPGPREKVVITAHRGASLLAPENTLSAIRKAIELGADMVEIDVQLTSDGEVVVIHDFDLMRIAGISRRVAEMTLSEIGSVDGGSWFSANFRDERVPTLEQVLDLARDRIKLNIELKYAAPNPRLARRVLRAISDRKAQSFCVISSLDYQGLMDVRQAAPDLPIGFIVGEAVGAIERLDVDFLSISARLLNRDLMNRARRQGKYVHVWTVNDRAGVERCLDLGVAGIMTDDPAMASEVVDQRSRLSDAEQVIAMFRRWLRG